MASKLSHEMRLIRAVRTQITPGIGRGSIVPLGADALRVDVRRSFKDMEAKKSRATVQSTVVTVDKPAEGHIALRSTGWIAPPGFAPEGSPTMPRASPVGLTATLSGHSVPGTLGASHSPVTGKAHGKHISWRPVVQRIADAVATATKGARHVHSACDRESLGSVTAEDLSSRLSRFSCAVSVPEAQAVVRQFDRTGNGRLSFSEFVAMLASASA